MKHIKTFQQLNESQVFTGDPAKDFKNQVKIIDDISKAILGSKELKDLIVTAQKENPQVKELKKYFDLATKAQKLVKKVQSAGLSKNKRESKKQLDAITKFAGTLKEGFKLLKTFKKKAEKGTEVEEGIGNMIGNALRSILTGKFIVNLISHVKTNMTDSYNEINTVQDLFDLKDY